MAYGKQDEGSQVGCNHPTSAAQTGIRFSAAIALFRTKREAADTLDVSTDQLTRYEKGTASPPLAVLTRLSSAKGISLDWLATGEGPMLLGDAAPPPASVGSTALVDEGLTARIFEGVSEVYANAGVPMAPGEVGRISAEIYNDLVRDFLLHERDAGLRGMFSSLRRRLLLAHTPPAATDESKRRA